MGFLQIGIGYSITLTINCELKEILISSHRLFHKMDGTRASKKNKKGGSNPIYLENPNSSL